jgi:hypothetical protein
MTRSMASKRSALVVGLIVAGLSLPAQAGKYTCTFTENGKAPTVSPKAATAEPCKIDTADPKSQTCQQKFAGVVATCGAASIDANLDGLLCAFTGGTPNAVDFLKDTIEPSIVNTIATLHKKEGFAAGAVNIAGPTLANVSIGYAVKKGAPQLAAVCSPTAVP